MLTSKVRQLVGITAIFAPGLHSVTDIMGWAQGGFSSFQLWLNYLAFVLMPFVLLGLYIVHKQAGKLLGLFGALLYGIAFVYFAHTTLYALTEHIATYELLLDRLGKAYIFHGLIMALGESLFVCSALREGWFPPIYYTYVSLRTAAKFCDCLAADARYFSSNRQRYS